MNFDALMAPAMHLISAHIDLVKAAVLGIVEGLTEFLPVSSTGHLLLMEHFLGWGDDSFGKSFAILIQLGAILALLSIYFGRIWSLATHMFTEWAAARFVIGVCQCLAMIPGVSRSGATIVGAMLFGADRRSAAEFSFWLAMPTMIGAFAYEAFKSRHELASGNIMVIAVGFLFSFIFGWIVVKTFLRYIQRHSFALFAWWRIIVGTIGIFAVCLLYTSPSPRDRQKYRMPS